LVFTEIVYAGRKGGDYVTDPECCLETKKSTTLAPQKNNEKLEATITVDNLVSTMKTSMPSEKILRERMKYFVLQDFRGYIILQGGQANKLLKNITYVEIGWIGQKRIKTREQTYMELMVEMMEEFIKELT
jgi:hypothetical protein